MNHLNSIAWFAMKPAYPRYQIRHDPSALFLNFDVVERRLDTIGNVYEMVVSSHWSHHSAEARIKTM